MSRPGGEKWHLVEFWPGGDAVSELDCLRSVPLGGSGEDVVRKGKKGADAGGGEGCEGGMSECFLCTVVYKVYGGVKGRRNVFYGIENDHMTRYHMTI